MAAEELQVGMKLLNLQMQEVSIVNIAEIQLPSLINVYNFTVQDNHNYFAQNILVHNNDPARYKGFQVVLNGQITEAINSPAGSEERFDSPNELRKTFDDLVKFTQFDRSFSIDRSLRNEIITNLTRSQEILNLYIAQEEVSRGVTYQNTDKLLMDFKNKVLKDNINYILDREKKLVNEIKIRYKSEIQIVSKLKTDIVNAPQKINSSSDRNIIVQP